MALALKDRVKETTTTAGTGTVTLAGAAAGFQSFAAVGNGNQTFYAIVDAATGDWEVGVGTYTASGTTLSRTTVVSSSNAGSLVPFAAGTKDVFVTYPASRSVYLDAAGSAVSVLDIGTLGTSTANITTANITAGTVTTTPTTGNDLVNKTYVDTMVSSGLTYHAPVKYEVPNTTGNLTALYNQPGGAGVGVGATLTNNGTKAAFAPDGPTASIGDRVLVYNQTNAFENGVYTVTTVGTPDPGGTNWVLTRATDADTYATKDPNGLGQGDAFFVTSGDTGAGETYELNTVGVITFGTTALTFVQISSAQVYKAGTGLNLSPSTTFNISNVGTAGTYGSASSVPVFVTNAQGQVTSVTPTAIAISGAAVSGNIAGSAGSVANALTAGSFMSAAGTFDGSAARTFNVDATSVNTASKVVARDASGNFSAGTITATLSGSATSATTATNLAGGAANQIPFQSGAGATSFAVAPTASGELLNWNGSSFSWTQTPSITGITLNGGTANGVAYLDGGKVLTTGTALTFDGTNLTSAIYRGFSNAGGAAAPVTLQAGTGTGLAGNSGGNGYVYIAGGGATNSWTSFAGGTFPRRRGGVLLQAGISALDAGATYFNGSTIQLQGAAGTTNGTSYGTGSQVVAAAGDAVNASAGTNTGAVLTLTGASSNFGGPASLIAGSGNATNNNGGAIDITAGNALLGFGTGGNLTLRAGNSTASNAGNITLSAGSTTTGLAGYVRINTSNAERMRINADGNVGLGVIPAPWTTFTTSRAFQFGRSGSLFYSTDLAIAFFGNNYYQTGAFDNFYLNNGFALRYAQGDSDGAHSWYTAPSGLADDPITFTEVMRLDADGNLGLGTDSPASRFAVVSPTNDPDSISFLGSPGSTASDWKQRLDSSSYHGRLRLRNDANSETVHFTSSGDSYVNGGNLGLGVPPAAWTNFTTSRAFQFGRSGSLFYSTDLAVAFFGNNYYQTGPFSSFYLNNGFALRYAQSDSDGSHAWYTAPSGTTGGAVTFTQAMTLSASGNLGIGTSSPAHRLDLGSGNFSCGAAMYSGTGASTGDCLFELGGNRTGSGNAYLDFHSVASTDYEMRVLRGGGANGTAQIVNTGTGDFQIQQTNAGAITLLTNNTERMRIDSSGNVGIGTSSPATRLHVFGSGTVNSFWANGDASGAALLLQDTGGSGGNGGQLLFGATFGIFAGIKGQVTNGTGPAGDLVFQTRGTTGNVVERMRIASTGNVGIGTATTTNGNLTIQQASATTGGPVLTLWNSNASGGNTCGYLRFFSNASARAQIHSVVDAGAPFFGNLIFSTGENTLSERMRVASNGNVDIGSQADAGNTLRYLDIYNSNTGASAGAIFRLVTSNVAGSSLATVDMVKYKNGTFVIGNNETNAAACIVFNNAGAERMRIDSSGNLLVGATTSEGPSRVTSVSTVAGTACFSHRNTAGAGSTLAAFINSNNTAIIGSISNNANTGVLYNATSDYRLKTVIGPVANAGQRIDALQPVEYTWNSDGSRTRGFLAHKFQEVYPSSVTGIKDAVDAEGKPVYQAMQASSSEVIADLVAELKSLRARVAALESN